jgi:hypothetical protein
MDVRTIRTAVLDGLSAGAVWQAKRATFRDAFLAGDAPVPMAELEMDSLAKMELCIAIEVGTGVSLAPEELDRYGTLGALVEDVARRADG